MRDPFGELSAEHVIIKKVLTALEVASTRADIALDFYARVADFAEQFADAHHHTKEELKLFTYLEHRGMPRDYGPLGVMISEHDTGREHIRNMRVQLKAGDLDALQREGAAFASLMRSHIAKEDEILFPMGMAMLTPEEIAEIGESFDTVAEPEGGTEAYAVMAEQLLAEAGIPA
jgi:hemerythrin-like domain-containing protein